MQIHYKNGKKYQIEQELSDQFAHDNVHVISICGVLFRRKYIAADAVIAFIEIEPYALTDLDKLEEIS